MTERDLGDFPEKGRLSSAEISMQIRGFFEDTLQKKPEDLDVWRKALEDIIRLRQQGFNLEKAKESAKKSRSFMDRRRLDVQRVIFAAKEKHALNKINKDEKYGDAFEDLSQATYQLEAGFMRDKTVDHRGATTRELKRVRNYVKRL